MNRLQWSLLSLAMAALAGGCPVGKSTTSSDGDDAGTTSPPPDAGTTLAPDAGTVSGDGGVSTPDAGTARADGGPDATVERLGGYIPAQPRALLTGKSSPFALHGSAPVVLDPAWFGLPATPGSNEDWLRSALLVHHTDTGTVRLVDEDDGVPTMDFTDVFGDYGAHAVPFLDMDWITPDTVFAAAGHAKVVRGSVDAAGTLTFTATTLRAPGANRDAVVGNLRARRGDLVVSTNQGVAVVDATTLAVNGWVTGTAFGTQAPWAYQVAVSGETAAVLLARPDATRMSRVALLRAGTLEAMTLDAEDGVSFTSVLGLPAGILVGVKEADGRGAIYKLVASATALSMERIIGADVLASTSLGNLVAHTLAYDSTRGQLLIGGQIDLATVSDTFSRTGRGVVVVDLDGSLTPGTTATTLVPDTDAWYTLLPWNVDLLHVDAQGRVWVGGAQLCNEHKLRALGVLRIERDATGVRAVRPFVSGVREIAVDPVNGHTWLGLRDENLGMQCDGANVQQHLCRLKADGSCEIYIPTINIGLNSYPATPATVAIAFGDPARRELTIATRHTLNFVQFGNNAFTPMTDIAPHLNNTATSAAWSHGALWIGSRMRWEEFNIPDVDDAVINDRGPHGLGLLEFAADAAPQLERRYVRQVPDFALSENVPGLPSDDVRDVLPLAGPRQALVACGMERGAETYDHSPGTPSSRHVLGGLAVVDDTAVHTVAAPEGVEVRDVMALAQGPGGTFFAIDADAGVLQVDVTALTATLWAPPAWLATERAVSLAVDADGRVAVATTGGLYVYGAGKQATKVAGTENGTYWKVRFLRTGLIYAGADQGLVRVQLNGGTLPVAGPTGLLPEQLWTLPGPCTGRMDCRCIRHEDCTGVMVCLANDQNVHTCTNACPNEGCICRTQATCHEPLVCQNDGIFSGGQCNMPDPCTLDPGGRDCTCTEGSCNAGLTCDCAITGCTCIVDAASCTAETPCACSDALQCPADADWYCNEVQGVCAQKQQCDVGCQCATPSGCSEGLVCRGMLSGNDCVDM